MQEDGPHALAPERFLKEVHTFDFWFQAVEGYLTGTTHGHREDLPEEVRDPEVRDRLVTALCNYCVGETAALEGASGLIRLAPNRMTKIFLATQVVDEGRHLEVFLRRLEDLGVVEPEREIERRSSRTLVDFKARLLQLIEAGEWEAALFAQNVILEAMEFAVFHSHAQTADPITREILEGVVKDERRHIGFGENELGRRLQVAPHLRARIAELKAELDHRVMATFEESFRQLGLPTERTGEVGRIYLEAVRRLGFA
jgi:1,2-phenylacetyl-CoA epoxidase catalytic subunit